MSAARARFECEKAEKALRESVYAAAVALSQLPHVVWDECDFEDLHPTLDAYVRLHGGDPDATREGHKTEPLHDLDRALIKQERARLAQLKANGKI